ncbi:hypothetical protein EYR38_009359 [Pleurotus pulmonarius]|nr:hypothetical protein EYR38_009359 [Pleurotus pulmonarius]
MPFDLFRAPDFDADVTGLRGASNPIFDFDATTDAPGLRDVNFMDSIFGGSRSETQWETECRVVDGDPQEVSPDLSMMIDLTRAEIEELLQGLEAMEADSILPPTETCSQRTPGSQWDDNFSHTKPDSDTRNEDTPEGPGSGGKISSGLDPGATLVNLHDSEPVFNHAPSLCFDTGKSRNMDIETWGLPQSPSSSRGAARKSVNKENISSTPSQPSSAKNMDLDDSPLKAPGPTETWQYPIPTTLREPNQIPVFGGGSLMNNVFTTSVATGSSRIHSIEDAVKYDMDGVQGSGCPGVRVDWRAGNIFTTFPWQIFQQKDTPFSLSHVAGHGNVWIIRIRSNRCNPHINTNGTVCGDCISTRQQRTFRSAEDRAGEIITPPHLNAMYLTHEQLASKLTDKGASVQDLKQTIRRRNTSLNSAHRAVTDHKRLLSAIATEDVNRMKHLVASGIRNRMSAKAILSNISNTIINLRTVKQYGQTDLDIAMLIRHYGGRKCLFAMSKALGLPSLSTLNRSAHRSLILPCTGDTKLPLLLANLEASFPVDISPVPAPSGYCLQIDGVAIRRNVRWIRQLDSIGGLCREHVEELDISMRTHDTTIRTWEAVHGEEPSCHYGSEATVAVFGAFNGTDYEPRPVLVSATCKAEKAPEFARLVRLLDEAWNRSASGVYGPLWCISTDGASTMRLGCHQVCTPNDLDPTDVLFDHLGGLPGLNLACGPKNITYSSDPKHCIKRIATLLRSKNGIMVNRQHINSTHLHSFLVLLDGEDDASIRSLIDPADHQNVPRAVKLMTTINMISTLKDSSIRPTDEPVKNALLALNDLIDAFIKPFINPLLSLSEQLTSLSKFAHLAFVHHRLHGTSFMINQLYADLQGVVKTAFFCVAKQKVLDRTKPFYLYQQGSDRLEQTFGTIRSMTHDQNVDVVQLCERLSDCVDVDKIFANHPDWKRAHRRLSYTGTEGVDHVNPKYFTGDLIVNNVVLSGVWKSGRIEADLMLQERHIGFDLKGALQADGVDFLCPYGGRKFIGVTEEHDASLDHETESDMATTGHKDCAANAIPENIQHTKPDASTSSAPDSVKDELADNNIHLEDYIGDELDQNGELTTSEDIPADWLEVPTGHGTETKPIHKASVLACLFKSGITKLSADRLSRVRGYTKDFKREEEDENLVGEAILRVKDIVVSVVQTGDKLIAPVFVAVSSISKNGKMVMNAALDEMHSSESTGIQIAGQVLAADLCDVGTTSLVWNGDYSPFLPPRARKQPVSSTGPINGPKNCHLVDFPGHLVFPLNKGLIATDKLPESLTKVNLESLGREVSM